MSEHECVKTLMMLSGARQGRRRLASSTNERNPPVRRVRRADRILLPVWEGKEIVFMSPHELHAAVERVRCEFLEMPGLRLTLPQAARLWGLDLPSCEAVIDVLIRSDFLRRTTTGAVTRAGD
jgi:hypothetical protein